MKCTIEKSDLRQAISAIRKISNKPGKVYLVVTDVSLDIIANTTSFLRFSIPASNTKKGKVSLQYALFENLLLLRGKTLKLSKTKNTLKVDCGSKLELYCSDMFKDDIKIPEIDVSKSVKIKSKGIAKFKDILSKVIFTPVDENIEGVPIIIDNTKKAFTLSMADSVHCAFYTLPSNISAKSFNITTDLSSLQEVFTFLEDKASLEIGSNFILIKSSNIVTTIPLLQVGTEAIKTAKSFLDDSLYKKGVIEFDQGVLDETLSSVSTVSEGSDIIKVAFKKKSMALELVTSFGKSNDSCKISKNTIGDIILGFPIILFENLLDFCSSGDKISLSLNKDKKFYKLVTEAKDTKIEGIGPISNI